MRFTPKNPEDFAISFARRLLVAAYLVSAGLLLVVAPWTASWQSRNYFGVHFALVGTWMANEFVCGAVSGVGVITTLAGLRDFASMIFAPRSLER